MKRRFMYAAIIVGFNVCFGAADRAELIERFIGVGCKAGTVVTAHAEHCPGWYACAYVYTPEAHITKEQLQEIATGIVAARSRKKPRSALLDSFEPAKRSFSLGRQLTPLSVGLYELTNKKCFAEHASWQNVSLLEGESLGIFGEASWNTKCSLKHEKSVIIERIIHMIIGAALKIDIPEHVSLDDAATKIAAKESTVQDRDLVVVTDVKAWKKHCENRELLKRKLHIGRPV